jgi:uncharacterized protein (DUF1501 family)
MLTLLSDRGLRGNTDLRRRDFLQVGTLGIGGLTLAGLLATKASAAGVDGVLKDKSVVILNLQGGPTHIETFDPKMTAPVEYRAMFGEVQTSIPGVTFGSHMANLARLADRMAIVRCFRHGIGSHKPASVYVAAGGNPTEANLGSIYARISGTNSPKTGIPTNCLIQPGAVGDEYKKLGAAVDRITGLGNLPAFYKPFDPSSGGEIVDNMKLNIPQNRLDDRRLLLERLDDFKRQVDGTGVLGGADQFQQQAYDVILGGISDAFNLAKEDPALVERYDTSMFDIPDALYKKKNKNLLKQSPISLGKQMLMARRLIEADCRFVTVTSAGWDMHGNAFGVDDGMPLLGSAMDRCVSAFLEDLEDRGLSEKVLLVITGEFGRTPRINKKGGRDHWGNLCTLAFAGGGLPMGQIIGKSDRTASVPAGDVVTAGQLLGTVMHTLLDIGKLRLVSGIPNDLVRIIDTSQTIPQLT